MPSAVTNPIVHLELHTDNLARARACVCAFYTRMFEWRAKTVWEEGGSYLALDLATGIGAGVVEDEVECATWLPYIEVADVAGSTIRAQRLGASVALEPREGPAGWRSVLNVPTGAEIALWQMKT